MEFNPTTPAGTTYSATNMMSQRTDTERLNALQELSGTYSNKIVCRWSISGRGWRLHETTRDDATTDIRKAIDAFLDDNIKE